MKTYITVTGVVFALILVAHGLRVASEGGHLLHEPTFIGTSALSLALALWAAGLLRRR